jgi:hypothetical protein
MVIARVITTVLKLRRYSSDGPCGHHGLLQTSQNFCNTTRFPIQCVLYVRNPRIECGGLRNGSHDP